MASDDPFRDVLAEMSGALRDIAERVGLPRDTDDYRLIVSKVNRVVVDRDSDTVISAVPVGESLAGLADRLVAAAAVAVRSVYWSRLGIVPVDGPDDETFWWSEWALEGRAAVAAVLDGLVEHGVRRDHLWLDRASLAAVARHLELAPDGGDGRRDQAPRVAPPTQVGA